MTKEEIDRLKAGEKLLRQITNIKKQIESLKKVKFITLTTSKEVKISFDRNYLDDLTTEKVVDYSIALNVNDTNPHPFAMPSMVFVAELIQMMEKKRITLQDQFNKL